MVSSRTYLFSISRGELFATRSEETNVALERECVAGLESLHLRNYGRVSLGEVVDALSNRCWKR